MATELESLRDWIITTLAEIEEMTVAGCAVQVFLPPPALQATAERDDPPPVWQRKRAANGRFIKKEDR